MKITYLYQYFTTPAQPAARGSPPVHGESFLVARDDAKFAEHIIRLLTRPDDRERIDSAARTIAAHSLDWEVLRQRVEEILQSVEQSLGLSDSARLATDAESVGRASANQPRTQAVQ